MNDNMEKMYYAKSKREDGTQEPNGDGLAYWPEADENMGYIQLGDGISTHEDELTDLEKLYYVCLIQPCCPCCNFLYTLILYIKDTASHKFTHQ